MPVFALKIKADLENVAKLSVRDDVMWKFDIQSGGGGDTKSGVTVTKDDVIELDGSKGEANFVVKWPGSKSQAYIKMLDMKAGTGDYTEDANGQYATVALFECRGLELVSYVPGMDFSAESTGGGKFEEVDMSEGDWADYDEDNDLAVSITNLESTIEKTK
jgi:hypothetical protein